jgi:hypothetical protein
MDVGASKVLSKIAATFKIVPTGMEGYKSSPKPGEYAAYASVFRPPKRYQPDTFVQKRGTRLSSKGEIGDIQSARKQSVGYRRGGIL